MLKSGWLTRAFDDLKDIAKLWSDDRKEQVRMDALEEPGIDPSEALSDITQGGEYGDIYCLRCGHKLVLDKIIKDGREFYHCSNEDCCHGGPIDCCTTCVLVFHHPHGLSRGPGDSYSLSYIK